MGVEEVKVAALDLVEAVALVDIVAPAGAPRETAVPTARMLDQAAEEAVVREDMA